MKFDHENPEGTHFGQGGAAGRCNYCGLRFEMKGGHKWQRDTSGRDLPTDRYAYIAKKNIR